MSQQKSSLDDVETLMQSCLLHGCHLTHDHYHPYSFVLLLHPAVSVKRTDCSPALWCIGRLDRSEHHDVSKTLHTAAARSTFDL